MINHANSRRRFADARPAMGKIDKIHSSGRYQVVRRGTVYAIDRPRRCLNVRSYAHARLSLSLSLSLASSCSLIVIVVVVVVVVVVVCVCVSVTACLRHFHAPLQFRWFRVPRAAACLNFRNVGRVALAVRGSVPLSRREREREREREGLLRADCDAAMHKATFVSARLPRFLRLSRRFVIREIGLLAADLP